MKKCIIFAVSLLLSLSSLSAAADLFFGVGVQATDISLKITAPEDGDSETKFTAKTSVDLTCLSSANNMGVKAAFSPNFADSEFGVLAAFAYRLGLGEKMTCVFSVGPSFYFASGVVDMGADLMADFYIRFTEKMLLRLGVGAETRFLQFKDGNTGKDFTLTVPMPSIAFAWNF